MNPPTAAALNPQAALYGNIPRLPSLSGGNGANPLGGAPGLVRSPSIPMIPPQLLAQLGQTGGLPRLHGLNPGLNLNQLTQLAAANQNPVSSVASPTVTPPAAVINGLSGVVSTPASQISVKTATVESEGEEKKIEEVNSAPASPQNSESP